MPRIYDFQNKDINAIKDAYLRWEAFPHHVEHVYGRGEVNLSDINPHGHVSYDLIRHSFSRTNADKAIYNNEANDRIHAWLSEHSTGRWHWLEETVNHGRSVDIEVWIENLEDREAFAVAWSGVFRRDLETEANNERINEDRSRSQNEDDAAATRSPTMK